ncbi:hypothetical protein SODALDRAFT_46249 [Sodiomyces alkalinus F11]|uniref:DUF7924 domain-containing protein n=1 Tax=Sodiomyces alkalinus (strain CBS 110278 / VKM F-3762 / F11) TaxID=1314773 RepID=A0A3N2QAF0_SODAK|nr:hypothetical protein SODALDRAFT_46249 [Sodiomyces alkalinus F11]ROT43732.1 hypothetical protein SODALDRAFT_46249 [Sodiomyces alkalinus F11]
MNSGVSKTRVCRSRIKISKALQEELLDAIASTDTELPQNPRDQSPVTPSQSTKRRLTTSGIDPLPAKRTRLEQTDAHQSGIQDQKAGQIVKPAPKHPPQQSYASFLKDLVDPAPWIHPSHPEPVHAFVFEWLESVGSDREAHCRSDSHLHRSDSSPVPRQSTRSAPDMPSTRDADGYAVPVPPTPSSAGSRSRRPSPGNNSVVSGASSPSSGVRHLNYRQNNLRSNGMEIQRYNTPLPDAVSGHINSMLRAQRDSPELSSDELRRAMDGVCYLADGCNEDDVARFLDRTILPDTKVDPTYGLDTGLASSSNSLMSQPLVPAIPGAHHRVSQPKPDRLYGYSGDGREAFTDAQFVAHGMIHPQYVDYPIATQGLRFPFFVVEFKAAGGTGGDLWVAANQCAGASAACVNAADQLNVALREHQSVHRVDNLSYSIAVENNTAQMYVSWKEENLRHYMRRVDAFLLSSPEHFKNFRKQVRNILDWGKDKRLKQIGDALDTILEENRKQAAERAKTREMPMEPSLEQRKDSRHRPALAEPACLLGGTVTHGDH